MEFSSHLVALRLHSSVDAQSPVGLIDKGELLTVVEVHLAHVLRAEGHEDVVLVVDQVFVRGRHYIPLRGENEIAHRIFEGRVFLLVEGVSHLRAIVPTVGPRAIGAIALPEEVGIEGRHRSGRPAEAVAIHEVVGNDGIDRTNIHFALLSRGTRFDEVFGKRLDAHHDDAKTLGATNAIDQSVDVLLALGQFDRALPLPELLIADAGVGLLNGTGLTTEQ